MEQTPDTAAVRPGKRAMRLLGRLVRGLVLTVILVVLAAAIAVTWLTQTSRGRALVVRHALTYVNEHVLTGTLVVSRLEGPIFRRLAIEEATLFDESGAIVASLDRIEAHWRLLPLLRQRVEVPYVGIHGLDVRGRILADGGLNLARIVVPGEPSPPSEGPGWAVQLASIELDEGAFVLRDSRNVDARLVVVDSLRLRASFGLSPEGTVDVDVAELSAGVAPPIALDERFPVLTRGLAFTIVGSEMSVAIEEFTAASTSLRGLAATVDLGQEDEIFGRIDMDLPTLHIDPDDVNAVLPDLRLLAPLTLTAVLGGPPEEVAFRAALTGPEGDIVAGATFDLSAPATPGYAFSIEANELQPQRWLDLGELNAEVSGRVELSGRGITPQDALLGLSLDLRGSRLGDVVLDKAIARIGYSAGTVRIEPFDAAIAGVTFRARGTGTLQGAVDMNVTVDAPDLAALRALHPALVDLAGSVRLGVEVEGVVPPDEVRQIPQNPIELARWLAARLRLAVSLDVDGLRAPGASVQQASLSISSPSASPPVVDLALGARGVAAGGVLLEDAQVEAALRDDALELRVAAAEAATGRSVRTSLRLTGEDRTVTAVVRSLEAVVPPVRLETTSTAEAQVVLSPEWAVESASLQRLQIRAAEANVGLDGRWNANGAVSARVTTEALRFEQVLPAIGVEIPLSGSLTATAELSGTLAVPVLSLNVQVPDLAWDTFAGIAVDWSARYAGRALRTTAQLTLLDEPLLRLETPDPGIPLRIDLAAGDVSFDMRRPMALLFGMEPFDLARLVEVVPSLAGYAPRGLLSAGISLAGTPASPLGQAAVRLDGFGADLPLEDGATVPLRDVALGASADYGIKYPGQALARARLTWEESDLVTLAATSSLEVGRLIAGEIDLTTWLTGLVGEIAVDVPAFDLGRLPGPLRDLAGIRDGTVLGTLHWRGTPSRGELTVHADAARLRLGLMPPIDASIDLGADENVRFDVRGVVDLAGQGSPWAGVAPHAPDAVELLDAEDSRAAVRLHGGIDASLRSLLRGGFRTDVPLRARIHVPGAPVALLAVVTDAPLPSTEGHVRGWLDLTGSGRAPQLLGRFALRDLSLLDGTQGAVGIEVAADATAFTVRAETCGGDGRTLVAEATADWVKAGPLFGDDWTLNLPTLETVTVNAVASAQSARIASVAPAFLAGTLVEELDGRFDLNATVTGPASAPRVDGTLAVSELDAGIIPLGRRFEDIRFGLAFSNERVELTDLQIRDGAGRVTGNGAVSLRGATPTEIDIALRFRDFLVADPAGNGLFVDGRAELSGGLVDDVVATELVLRDVSLTVPAQAPPSTGPTAAPGTVYFVGEDVDASQVGSPNPTLLGAGEEAETTELPPIDVRIRTQGRNFVYHSLAEVQFEVELLAGIRTGEFRLDGNVRVPSGRVTFAGKSFDITRGIVQFDGQPNDVNPVIDVEATHFLSGSIASRLPAPSGERAQVRVTVNGDLDEILSSSGEAVRLQSDPEMSKQDVIFVLLTGRPRNDESAVGAEQQALATAGSLLLGLLGDRLLDGMPIDTLRIEGDSQTGQAISRVEGGKYISDDVYVSGSYINSQDPEDNDFEFALEWIIARFSRASIRTELRAGNRAKGGVELLYQFIRAGRSRVSAPDVVEVAPQ